MQTRVLIAVGVGGGLGSLLRYFVASLIQSAAWPGFPWGIFFVNISGGFVMGVIAELSALRLNLAPDLRAFLTVGVLGGYTTFSTFALDSALLIERGDFPAAAAYVAGSAILSVVALFAGLWLVRTV